MSKFLSFNNLPAGTVIDDEFAAQGVTISAVGGSAQAMVFDTTMPSGGDSDLAATNFGNVLVISEDGDTSDPDDNASGGSLIFDFDEPATINRLSLFDIEEGATLRFFDPDGVLTNEIAVPAGQDNTSIIQDIDVDNVGRMEVVLNGSGAVDNLVFDPFVPDGVVEGDNDDDLIDINYDDDPDGDRIDNGDAVLPGEIDDDDIVDAFGGNDTVLAGEGDDDVYAGSGNDSVEGGDGDDLIFGDSNFDGPNAGASQRESFEWDLAGVGNGQPIGNFTQDTGNVEVGFTILNETGSVITDFASNLQNVANIDSDGDPVNANSSIISDASGVGSSATYGLDFSEAVERVSFRVNDIDISSQVEIRAFDDAGNEIPIFLEAGDNVTLTDTDGDGIFDTATSNGGAVPDTDAISSLLVSVAGPVARIEITHNSLGSGTSGVNITDIYFDAPIVDDGAPGNDNLDGGAGDDVIFGEDGNDTIDGGDGNDEIDAGDGFDIVDGGTGEDTIRGGGDNDQLNGGDDADTIIIDQLGSNGVNNTTVDGNSGGDDNDTLDISPLIADGWNVVNLVQNPENRGNPGFDGQIQLERGGEFANINFFDIEELIICFTPGSRIATPSGTRPVEELREGDRVFTRDNGIQEIRWAGQRHLTVEELAKTPKFMPIMIRKGALGANTPERDMVVSPNHRMLIVSEIAQVMFGEREVLVAAKHLLGLDGVSQANVGEVSYVHILFDQHEVVLGDATWSESFQPGDYSMRGIADQSRDEILALFPELATTEGLNDYSAARMSLKKHEAKLLVHG